MLKIDVFPTLPVNFFLFFVLMTLQSTYTTPNYPYPRQNLAFGVKDRFYLQYKIRDPITSFVRPLV
jgi:hypothetical protein